jgi:hypothetical protein
VGILNEIPWNENAFSFRHSLNRSFTSPMKSQSFRSSSGGTVASIIAGQGGWDIHPAVIFGCELGKGRSTMGMVIAALWDSVRGGRVHLFDRSTMIPNPNGKLVNRKSTMFFLLPCWSWKSQRDVCSQMKSKLFRESFD